MSNIGVADDNRDVPKVHPSVTLLENIRFCSKGNLEELERYKESRLTDDYRKMTNEEKIIWHFDMILYSYENWNKVPPKEIAKLFFEKLEWFPEYEVELGDSKMYPFYPTIKAKLDALAAS